MNYIRLKYTNTAFMLRTITRGKVVEGFCLLLYIIYIGEYPAHCAAAE